ncbi:hypothetical protein AB7294_15005, partial [Cylindrospermopsis raciborskii UAM/DH-MRr]|uniref:hypothetical protein n=1 Tax=Cylindrospermopsis raciborskii TaxID=77022 RepID=UPI0038797B49
RFDFTSSDRLFLKTFTVGWIEKTQPTGLYNYSRLYSRFFCYDVLHESGKCCMCVSPCWFVGFRSSTQPTRLYQRNLC